MAKYYYYDTLICEGDYSEIELDRIKVQDGYMSGYEYLKKWNEEAPGYGEDEKA